jgi:hypothetical protein
MKHRREIFTKCSPINKRLYCSIEANSYIKRDMLASVEPKSNNRSSDVESTEGMVSSLSFTAILLAILPLLVVDGAIDCYSYLRWGLRVKS